MSIDGLFGEELCLLFTSVCLQDEIALCMLNKDREMVKFGWLVWYVVCSSFESVSSGLNAVVGRAGVCGFLSMATAGLGWKFGMRIRGVNTCDLAPTVHDHVLPGAIFDTHHPASERNQLV